MNHSDPGTSFPPQLSTSGKVPFRTRKHAIVLTHGFLLTVLPLILATVSTTRASGEILGPPQGYPAVTPNFVALGDLNGDGAADIAVTNQGGTTVQVLLGDGKGGFGPATGFLVGSDPFSVAIGDLDGDGKLDLAVADRLSNVVSVLLGDGSGSFGPHMDFSTGSRPVTLALSHLDGDNRLDIVVSNGQSNSVSVLLGNGDGSFGASSQYPAGLNPRSLSVADFNGDAKPDVVTADFNDGTVSVLLGNGDGTLAARIIVPVGINPRNIAARDVNGDAKLDLIVTNSGSSSVSVLLGTGDGNFVSASPVPVEPNPWAAGLADLDGDGKFDLVVTHAGTTGLLSVRLGNGDGSFGSSTTYSIQDPVSVAIGNLNHAAGSDIAVASLNSDSVFVLLNTGPLTAVRAGDAITQFWLGPPAPNPFRTVSRIRFSLRRTQERVEIRVHDVSGRMVRQLELASVPAGEHFATWDGRDDAGRAVGTGMYFFCVRAGTDVAEARIAHIK